MRLSRLCIVVLLFTASAFAQERFGEQINVTAVELTLDVRDKDGKVPQDLKPSDFVVIESGVQRPVTSLDYLRASRVGAGTATGEAVAPDSPQTPLDANVVVYFDLEFMAQSTARDALRGLRENSARLLALGPVDVIVSNPMIAWIARGARDTATLDAAFEKIGQLQAHDRLGNYRRGVIQRLQMERPADTPALSMTLPQARATIREEEGIIGAFDNRLLRVLGTYPRRSLNALFLTTAGFDLDPYDFYSEFIRDDFTKVQLKGDTGVGLAKAHDDVTRQIAAAGWTVTTLAGGVTAWFRDDASTSGAGKAQAFIKDQTMGSGQLIATPRDPLLALAEATGGTIVSEPARFATTIESIGDRIRITYEVPRAADANARKVEVRSLRPGLKVRTSRWTSSSTPELTASSRVLEQLEGTPSAATELPLTARVQLDAASKRTGRGTLDVRAELAAIAPLRPQLTSTTVRVSVAVAAPNRPPAIVHQVVDHYDLSKLQRILFTAPLQLEAGATKVAVVLEELTSGAWGATSIDIQPESKQREFASAGWGEEQKRPPVVESDGISWMSWTEGLARAHAEKKLIFVAIDQPAVCLGCKGTDRTAFRHPAFRSYMEEAFVPVRAKASELKFPLRDGATSVVADPWGRYRYSWAPRDPADMVSQLARVRQQAMTFTDAGAALDDKHPEAWFQIASSLAQLGEFRLAREHYAKARALATNLAQFELAERADIHSALLDAREGSRDKALRKLEQLAAATKSDANAAEALIIIANIRKAAKDEKGATEAFSRAAARAPHGSDLEVIALTGAGQQAAPLAKSAGVTVLKPIQLVRPRGSLFAGRVNFQTLVRDPRVDKVIFSIDGQALEPDVAPPFSARIDVGDDAKARTIRVEAYARDGSVLGDDTLIINERHDQFAVRIASPRGGEVSGTTKVELEVQRPRNAVVDRVDIYWNEEKKATLRDAPFVANLVLPSSAGYIRAVAFLADGTTAEDAMTLNLRGYTESVDVELAEIYARVTDKNGKAVTNLDAGDFSVSDDGRAQEVVRAEFLEQPPLLIGVAVDRSGSMREEMLETQLAARQFLSAAFAANAKAFLVGFDDAPQLLHVTTDNLESISSRIDQLRVSGASTAMYDALTFCLLQFDGARGKKALVVVSDGDDRSSRYSYQDVIAFARRAGVAIYAIIIDENYMGQFVNSGDTRRHNIGELTIQTGGKAFYLHDGRNLDAVYREIDDQLGSEYVIAFRPTIENRKPGEFRPLEVKAKGEGLKVQATPGYEVK